MNPSVRLLPLVLPCLRLSGPVVAEQPVEASLPPELGWFAPPGHWRVYGLGERPAGQKVKRAAPGNLLDL